MRIMILVLVLMVVGACSSEPAPAPTAPVQTVDRDDRALEVLQQEFPGLNSVPESTVKRTGRTVCQALDSGLTLEQIVVSLASEPSIRPKLAGAVLAFGIFSYCPEYKDQIPDL